MLLFLIISNAFTSLNICKHNESNHHVCIFWQHQNQKHLHYIRFLVFQTFTIHALTAFPNYTHIYIIYCNVLPIVRNRFLLRPLERDAPRLTSITCCLSTVTSEHQHVLKHYNKNTDPHFAAHFSVTVLASSKLFFILFFFPHTFWKLKHPE